MSQIQSGKITNRERERAMTSGVTLHKDVLKTELKKERENERETEI